MSSADESKKEYVFGGLEELSLEEIENEILQDNGYLDVFAGSDLRFKDDVSAYTNSLDKLMQLNVIQYEYNQIAVEKGAYKPGRQIGVIAQELSQVAPELVAKDNSGHLFVNYEGMVPMLVGALQDINKIVEKQELEIIKLKQLIKSGAK